MATTNLIDNMDDAFSRRFLNKIKFDRPTAKTRAYIWKSKLKDLDDKTYEKLSTYDLSGGQIENVSRKYLINKSLNVSELVKGTYILKINNQSFKFIKAKNKNSIRC